MSPGSADRGPARLLAAAVACGVLALAVLPFEPAVLRACNARLLEPALPLWHWFDRSAPRLLQTAAVAVGVALLAWGGSAPRRRAGAVLILGFCVAMVLTSALKSVTGRARPLADPDHAATLASPAWLKDDRSFPSGHVSNATAICAALWLASRRRRLRNFVWLVPPAMALDRVCLAVHWPSDVLGGAALGLLATAAVAFAAGGARGDRALIPLGPGGSAFARWMLSWVAVLGLTRIWVELPLGRDPVSGQAVPGFTTEPHALRVAFEPLFGPPLHLALEDARAVAWPLVAWFAAAFGALALLGGRAGRRLAAVAVLLAVAWIGTFWRGWAPPDRFVARDRHGVFVDWHLHAGDPYDGAISLGDLRLREARRGVGWPILTHHSRVSDEDAMGASAVAGTEWSGPLPKKGEPWAYDHLLLIGDRVAIGRVYDDDFVSAQRAAGRAAGSGQLVIAAHAWRPEIAGFDSLVEAGVHGFEVGNRRRDTDPAALGRLRELDRRCRERGLLRFSFSDDHGIPAGSPCVTFLEGVGPADLARGPSVIARLRGPDRGGITPIPLLFHPGDPTLFPPRWLAPPVMAFEYFRSLRLPQRASWLAFAALAGLWIFRAKRHTGAF